MSDSAAAIAPDDFYQAPLHRGHFNYTVDLSRVPCHCNAAAYLVEMPAPDPGVDLDYYCDANFVKGVGCPEYDVLESNKHVVSGALHECVVVPDGGDWYSACDGDGCSGNSWDQASGQLCNGLAHTNMET